MKLNNTATDLALYPTDVKPDVNSSHAEREHARLGGSSASRWMNCPGSVALIEDLPPSPPSQAAMGGTEAHEYAEKALRSFLNYKVTSEWLSKEDFSDIIPEEKHDEMLPMVQEYVKCVYERVLLNDVTGKAWGLEDNFCIDRKLEMCGFVDFWAIYRDKKGKRVAIILDFKYGYHYVSATKNSQLAFYACALRSWLNDNGKDIDYVRCAIYQPRNRGFEGDAYRETKYSAKQLDSWKSKFTKAAQQIFSGKKAKTKAGSHCMFCPAKAICHKYLQYTNNQAAIDLLDADLKLPAPETLEESRLAKILTYGDLVTDYIAALKQYAINRHNDGKPVAGLKVIKGPTRRTWIDDEEAIKEFLDRHLDSKDFIQTKLKGITAIEKKLSHDLKEELNKAFVTETEAKLTVVPDNDANMNKAEVPSHLMLLGD